MLLAVAVTLATPALLVTAVPLDKTAPAPVDGGVKVTVAPATGIPLASFTVACSAFGNAAPNRADCTPPPVAVILAGGDDVLVSENVVISVPTLAVTV